MIPCPFHLMTGFDCPFCGMQRALVALSHGNIAEAFGYNPVVWCLAPYFAIVLMCSLSTRVHNSTIGKWAMSNKTIFSVLGVLATWGITRNLI